MTKQRNALGAYGEDIAANYLANQGLRIEQRNWRCEQGEVDIVAVDHGELVICEVKTRRNTRYGHPIEAVTPRKLVRLRKLAGLWLKANSCDGREREKFTGVRIDVVGVLVEPGVRPQLTHLKAVG
ncbi:MAG: YraN family protein [Candidatus Nanopelagicales bacterium]